MSLWPHEPDRTLQDTVGNNAKGTDESQPVLPTLPCALPVAPEKLDKGLSSSPHTALKASSTRSLPSVRCAISKSCLLSSELGKFLADDLLDSFHLFLLLRVHRSVASVENSLSVEPHYIPEPYVSYVFSLNPGLAGVGANVGHCFAQKWNECCRLILMRTKFLHHCSAAAPVHVPSQPRSFAEALVILQAIVIPKMCLQFQPLCSYISREDPFRTRNPGDAWSSWRAATMSLATSWFCRNAQDRNGSLQTCCLAPCCDRPLGGTCRWIVHLNGCGCACVRPCTCLSFRRVHF